MSAEDLDAEACVKMATNTRNTNKLKREKSANEVEVSREEEKASVARGSIAWYGR